MRNELRNPPNEITYEEYKELFRVDLDKLGEVEDLEDEYDPDDYPDEEELELLRAFMDHLEAAHSGVHIADPRKIAEVNAAYEALKTTLVGVDLVMSFAQNVPFVGTATIHVRGKEIEVSNQKQFTQVCKLTSTFEVTPYLDGTVEMNFTFYGLTKKIGE